MQLGKHSAGADTGAGITVQDSFRCIADCEAVPKPGSRRARREAERVAARAVAKSDAKSVSEENTPPAEKVYAEYMNEHLVLSQLGEIEIRAKNTLFNNARLAVITLVAASSIFGVAAGHASLEDASTKAYAAIATLKTQDVNVPAIKKIPYTVHVDGKALKFESLSGVTIAQALKTAGVQLGAQDEVSIPLNRTLVAGAEIKIARITAQTVTEEYTDKFENRDEEDPTLPKGEKKIETIGVDGKGTRTFIVKYRDGEEISREITAEAIATVRQDQITKVGTKEPAEEAEKVTAPPAGPAPSPGSARAIAQEMLAGYGWGDEQFACLDNLWQRESKWNTYAQNPSSGAYGIPQSLPGSKMASAGADWKTNPATQIRWGLGYIQGRYGSPCGAWGHSQSRGWY